MCVQENMRLVAVVVVPKRQFIESELYLVIVDLLL